ncbi:hypothetical protein BH10PLA1_BH10PLA1_19380 [soil metagenome]
MGPVSDPPFAAAIPTEFAQPSWPRPNVNDRLAAGLIDAVVVWGVYFVIVFRLSTVMPGDGARMLALSWFAIQLCIEVTTGLTAGKKLVGLCVWNADGTRPTLVQFAVRAFVRRLWLWFAWGNTFFLFCITAEWIPRELGTVFFVLKWASCIAAVINMLQGHWANHSVTDAAAGTVVRRATGMVDLRQHGFDVLPASRASID